MGSRGPLRLRPARSQRDVCPRRGYSPVGLLRPSCRWSSSPGCASSTLHMMSRSPRSCRGPRRGTSSDAAAPRCGSGLGLAIFNSIASGILSPRGPTIHLARGNSGGRRSAATNECGKASPQIFLAIPAGHPRPRVRDPKQTAPGCEKTAKSRRTVTTVDQSDHPISSVDFQRGWWSHRPCEIHRRQKHLLLGWAGAHNRW